MKTKINLTTKTAILTCFLVSFLSNAQCSDYYPMSKGTVYEITHYDKNDKVESVTHNEIVNAASNMATIHTSQTDTSGKEIINASYDMKCDGDGVAIDINKLISEQLASKMTSPDIKVEINGTDLIMPNNLKSGQLLPDSIMNMDIIAPSMTMNCKVKTYERKVVGEETITTPAGTFDCVVLESKSDIKMIMSKHTTSKIWISKGVGVVKQETYSKKGKLEGREMLTAFKK